MTAEEITNKLNLEDSEILNIYPYGSRIYGTATEDSDSDFIIVYKAAFLKSGAFKNNAISSEDKKVQGSCYSRTGFIDAINNYQMPALESIFLPDDKIVKKKWPFKMQKYEEKQMVKKVISLASSSWHNATLAHKDENYEYISKNIYHAIRILNFGLQIKETGSIKNYSSTNDLYKELMEKDVVKPKEYIGLRDELMSKLRA